MLAIVLALANAPLSVAGDLTPIDRVWGYGVTGTKDLRELDPDSFGRPAGGASEAEVHERFLASKVLRLKRYVGSSFLSVDTPNPFPCVVVAGQDEQALDSVARELLDEETPPEALTAGEPLSLFFGSPQTSYAFRLVGIERAGNQLIIRYSYRLRSGASMSTPLLLAPLGSFSPGRYEITLEPAGGDASDSESGSWPGHRIEQPRFASGAFEVKANP